MTAHEFKQSVIIEKKQDKIESLIKGYREILRQLNHNHHTSKTKAERVAFETARNIVEESMIQIADINLND